MGVSANLAVPVLALTLTLASQAPAMAIIAQGGGNVDAPGAMAPAPAPAFSSPRKKATALPSVALPERVNIHTHMLKNGLRFARWAFP